MESRPFGKTGELATVIGLGGACLYKHSFADGVATVRRALELGVTYFDTSPFYCEGMSQAILGDALSGRSDSYMLATKIGHLAVPSRFRSRDALRTQFEDSLQLLRRKSVDVLQVHESDWHCWWSDDASEGRVLDLETDYDFAEAPIIQVLREAKAEGLCRFVGISGNSADQLARVLDNVEVDTCLSACHYDVIGREARSQVIPIVRERGLALMLGQVFVNGKLAEVRPDWVASSKMSPERKARIEQLYELQAECGLSLVTLAVRFLLADSVVTTILVGASTPAEIEEDVAAAEAGPLPQDLYRAVEALGWL